MTQYMTHKFSPDPSNETTCFQNTLRNGTSGDNITQPPYTGTALDPSQVPLGCTQLSSLSDSTDTINGPRHNRKSLRDRRKAGPHDCHKCTITDYLTYAEGNIANFSNLQLDRDQKLLLTRGLSFIPTATHSEPKEMMKDLGEYIKNIKSQFC